MDDKQPKRRKNKQGSMHDAAGELAQGVSEFTQLALWMAATVAGLVTAMLIARRPFFESLLRSVGKGGPNRWRVRREPSRAASARRPIPPTPEESLPLLADAIVGNTKAAVASVFGPPRSAALRGVVSVGAGKAAGYWQATTWYYPLPRNDALAMAIEFDDDAARRVEFFRAPGL